MGGADGNTIAARIEALGFTRNIVNIDDDAGNNNNDYEYEDDEESSSSDDDVVDVTPVTLQLHESINHDGFIHCPPLENITLVLKQECDCFNFGFITCLQQMDVEDPLDIIGATANAWATANSLYRLPNSKMRKKMYKTLYRLCCFPNARESERHELPRCGCALIRKTFPSSSGWYVGYHDT